METIKKNGILYAEVIWASEREPVSRFYSDAESSLQFGILAHEEGFTEAAHSHFPVVRTIQGTHQMFVMQFGVVEIAFYDETGKLFRSLELRAGDAIVLADGIHSLKVIEKFQAVSVKQGPFLGDSKDKIEATVNI